VSPLPLSLPAGFPPVPLLDVEALLRGLPPESRARITWPKRSIEGGLARVRSESLTGELLSQVTEDILPPFASLLRAIMETAGANRDEWQARLVGDLKAEERDLAAFIDRENAHDTLRWIVGLIQSFLALAFSASLESVRVETVRLDELGADEDFKPYLRGVVALMAAAETRKLRGDRQWARDLVDVAFLQLSRFRANLRTHGVSLMPFPFETLDDRRERLARSADALRKALTEDDWLVIEEARVGSLR
jgi:hypothetical protein